MTLKVRYIYSACVVIENDDVSICCDPWFTPGIYDGSWYQYPSLEADPLDVIGRVSFIYVSHIHPDHYDARFLKRYLARYPDTRLLVGRTEPPFLLQKMRVDGFGPLVFERGRFGETELAVLPNRANEVDNIDTGLVVRRGSLSVANLNDNPFDDEQVRQVRSFCGPEGPTVALLPYTGAGPYPQTYEFASEEDLEAAAERKKQQFLDLYSRYVRTLTPRRAIPFAGQYVLGGPLATLNRHRGLADATEAMARHRDVSVVLADGGRAVLDVETLSASAVRSEPYDARDVQRYVNELAFPGYDYEREIRPADGRELPLLPLAQSAYARAIKHTPVKEPFWFCLRPDGWRTYLAFETSVDTGVEVLGDVSSLQPRCEIFIDGRYLFGLLTRLYHWNNAAIGSQYRARRVPDRFRREAYAFLNRFHV